MSAYGEILNRFRNRPAAIAAAAGGVGLLCGALAVGMSSPTPPSATAPQVSQVQAPQVQVALKPAAETTGAAPQATTSDCDEQTWPYITRECLAKRHAERSRVRIITTDRITPPAPAAVEPERTATADLSPRETVHSPVPAATAAVKTPVETVAAETVSVEDVSTEAVPLPLPRPEAASDVAEKTAAAPSNRVRNARLQQREQGKLRRAAQSVRADDVDDETPRPRGRVVERWTEREFEVPSERGMQRRRVIVRSGGEFPPGPFGAMFGTVFR